MTCASSLKLSTLSLTIFYALRLFIISLLAISITGCGFHLRGSSPLPTYLESLTLDWQNAEPNFRQQMEKSLQRAGVTLGDNSNTTPISLHLRHTILPKRPITFAGNGLVAQYELSQQLEFQLGILSPSANWQPITVTRQYDYVPNNVTANQSQERQLHTGMQRELIQQLIRRLQFTQVQSSTASANPAPEPGTQPEGGE